MTIAIHQLLDDAKCYEMIRESRWPDGVCCPHCKRNQVVKNGHDTTEPCRQRYLCHGCDRCFDDLTKTVFAGHHQPLRIWMLCSYFMGLNLSNKQIGAELGLSTTQAHEMAMQLRQGIANRQHPFAIARVSTLEMKMETGFTRCMSIRWKEFGPFFAVGYALTGAFLRKTCRCISPSSSSPTTFVSEEKHSSQP